MTLENSIDQVPCQSTPIRDKPLLDSSQYYDKFVQIKSRYQELRYRSERLQGELSSIVIALKALDHEVFEIESYKQLSLCE